MLQTPGMKGKVRGPRRWAALLTAGALAIGPSTTHAAAPPAEVATEIVALERPATRSFYGWQILATGEVGGVVAAAATVIPDSPLKTLPSTVGFLLGMPFYALGGPATHWTHGEFHKGLISLGGTFALPVLGGFIGQGVRCAPADAPSDCGASGFFTGFAIALVTAPLIDALVLGWEDIPDDDPEPTAAPPAPRVSGAARRRSRATPAARFTMIPAWSVGPKGELAFGVAGRF